MRSARREGDRVCSDRPLHLAGLQALGAHVGPSGSALPENPDPLQVGHPGAAGLAMRVTNGVAGCRMLVANDACLCHGNNLSSPIAWASQLDRNMYNSSMRARLSQGHSRERPTATGFSAARMGREGLSGPSSMAAPTLVAPWLGEAYGGYKPASARRGRSSRRQPAAGSGDHRQECRFKNAGSWGESICASNEI